MRRLVAVLCLAAAAACSGEGGGDIDAFCAGARAFRDATDALVTGPATPEEAPAAARAAQRVEDAARAMRADAPADVAADVDTLTEVSVSLARRLRVHYETVVEDPARADDAEFLSGFEISAEEERSYRRASRAVQPVVDGRCGVRARPTVTTGGPVPQGQ